MKEFELPSLNTVVYSSADLMSISREDEFPITPVGLDEFPLAGVE